MASILHLIDSLSPKAGGPVTFVRDISAAHQQMGHKVSLVLLTDALDASGPPGVEVCKIGRKSRYGGFGYALGLVGWLRKHGPEYELIYVHGLWQYHGPAAWLALAPLGVPYYVFPHGMLDPWFTGNQIDHWKKLCYWQVVERHVLRTAEAVLFTSEREKERAPRSFGAPWKSEELVRLGIPGPPNEIEAQKDLFLEKWPALRGKRFILFLGRLDRKKGCELLAKAFAELCAEDMHLVFCGPSSDTAYVRELEECVRHCAARVHFTGMLEGAEKWGAFRCAEVFALPSHQENFGIAVAEALACGLPVLLSTSVDIHEQVLKARAGYAAADTLEGMRQLLRHWRQTAAETRMAMREAARACFRTHFDIRQTAHEMLSLKRNGGA